MCDLWRCTVVAFDPPASLPHNSVLQHFATCNLPWAAAPCQQYFENAAPRPYNATFNRVPRCRSPITTNCNCHRFLTPVTPSVRSPCLQEQQVAAVTLTVRYTRIHTSVPLAFRSRSGRTSDTAALAQTGALLPAKRFKDAHLQNHQAWHAHGSYPEGKPNPCTLVRDFGPRAVCDRA